MKNFLVVSHVTFCICGFILGNHVGYNTSQHDCKIQINEFIKKVDEHQKAKAAAKENTQNHPEA